ncbi:MAG: HYR domain-containing protein, partial [Nitrososphaerales archaeon]
GHNTVTCSATDAAGNVAVDSFFDVFVEDTTSPTIDPHDDITTEATSAAGATVEYTSPATHDAVDGDGTATCAPASGATFAPGHNTVTCSATDAAGNVAVDSFFDVFVEDTTSPIIDAHADETAQATSSSGATVAYTSPATHDAVDGDSTAICAPASGATFAPGHNTVTCSATDSAGNHAIPTTFTINIVGAIGSEDITLIIAPGGTVSSTTSDGTIWSLTQSSNTTGILTMRIGTLSNTIVYPNGTTVTFEFIGQVVEMSHPSDISLCAPDCTVSIAFTKAQLDAAGLLLNNVTISHDANHNGLIDPPTEILEPTVQDKDGNNCVVEGVVVCDLENGPFIATVQIDSFSAFVLGGVALIASGRGGGGGEGSAPTINSFSVTSESQEGFAAIIELDPNTPHTNVVNTFDPSTVTMRLSSPEGPQSIKHVGIYLNLGGIFREISDSDTYIVWDKNQPLQVVDPHGILKDVSIKPSTIGKNLQLVLHVTFVKEMPKSDIIVRTWDQNKFSKDTRYRDSLEVVMPKTIAPESQVPEWVKNNAKWWAEGSIDESDFVAGIQYLIKNGIINVPSTESTGSSTTIPDWIKNNAQWWADDLISENDFMSGIQWMVSNGIIIV